MSSISGLPNEVLVEILYQLGFSSLIRCERVCSRFKDVIEQSALLQYHIELFLAGCQEVFPVAGESSKLSTADRRSRLKRHVEAWKALQWTKSRLTIPAGDLWDSFGRGVFATGSLQERWMAFAELPSTIRGTSVREWTLNNMNIRAMDFTMDMDQDLLVLFEEPNETEAYPDWCFHVRTVSSGVVHPWSANGVITIHTQGVPYERHNSCNTRVIGNKIGALIDTENCATFILMDWYAGEVLMEETSRGHDTIQDFSFMDTDCVLITRPSYTIGAWTNRIEIYNISSLGVMTHTASFLLPSLHPTTFSSNLSIRHTRPHIPITTSPPPQISTRPPLSFQCASEHRMIVLNWGINIPLSGTVNAFQTFSYKIVLLRSAILARAADTTVEPGIAINWEDWGPANTRLWGNSTTWDIDVDNSRVFTTDPFWDNVGNGGQYVNIITPLSHDSPPRKSDSTNEHLERGNTLTYIVPSSIPTILSKPEVFSDGTVTTRLGCRIIRLLDHDVSEHASGSLLVDEEHIVWMSVSEDDAVKHLEILTLKS